MAKHSTAAAVTSELDISSTLASAKTGSPESDHVQQLLESFEQTGPNGAHRCLVYEPMGGTVASMLEMLPQSRESQQQWPRAHLRYPKWMAKRILKHTLRGIAFLHSQGVVHGDLQCGNLLFGLKEFTTIDATKIGNDAENRTRPLTRLDGMEDLWAPRYLVLSQPLYEYADIGRETIIKISDLGAGELIKGDKPIGHLLMKV